MAMPPRRDWLDELLPDDPGLCETCRERPAAGGRYCSTLCALFDDALDRMAAELAAADGARFAAPVVAARTRLRAVAAEYDYRRLRRDRGDPLTAGAAADWAADVADGLLLPVDYDAAVREVRERAGPG